jgi:hypothetical protein
VSERGVTKSHRDRKRKRGEIEIDIEDTDRWIDE